MSTRAFILRVCIFLVSIFIFYHLIGFTAEIQAKDKDVDTYFSEGYDFI